MSISQYPYHFSETKRCLFRAIDDHVRVKTKRCSFQESKYFIFFFVCSYFFRGMVRHNGSVLIKLRLLNFDAIFGICTFWHDDGMMDRWCHCQQLKPKTKHIVTIYRKCGMLQMGNGMWWVWFNMNNMSCFLHRIFYSCYYRLSMPCIGWLCSIMLM